MAASWFLYGAEVVIVSYRWNLVRNQGTVVHGAHADTTNLAESHFAFFQGRQNEVVLASKSDRDTAE
jgi:hypothetical protein